MLPYMQTLQPWIGFRISERDVQTRVYFQGKPMVEKQRLPFSRPHKNGNPALNRH